MPRSDVKYRFGPFEVHLRARQLYKHGTRLKLRPQAFQILQLLLERAGDVVTREELRQHVWSSETFVDFEHGLNTAIKELRGALSDSATQPRYIETLPKLGYRALMGVERDAAEPTTVVQAVSIDAQGVSLPKSFRETVEINTSRSASQSSEENQISFQSIDPEPRKSPDRRRWALIVAAASLLLLVIATGYWQWQHSRGSRAQGRIMLAVLPFDNLTGDPEQDYFSDGLTEEMISQLGQLDPANLAVIARTSVMRYKRSQEPLDQIGRELGVQYVLEGSVRRDTDNVRISAQLVRAKDQTPVFSRQYDRELKALLPLQAEIAQEVADEIQLTLGGSRASATAAAKANPSPAAIEAYDLYLRGRYFWNKRNKEGFDQALKSFQQAIAKDPNYAPAYAGLADTYSLMGPFNPKMMPREIMPRAREAALKALQLDEKLAEAHTSLALIAENYDYDWQTAEKEYRRAIELNSSYATAHQWYAECLMWQGRFDEALQESERARQLDPFSLIIASDRGAILYYARKYDAAIEQLKAVLAMDPNFSRAHFMISVAYLHKGMWSESLAGWDKDLDHCATDPGVCEWLAYAYSVAGQPDKAGAAAEELERLIHLQQIHPDVLIAGDIVMGQKDRAFQEMERGYSERANFLTSLKVDPLFDPLRNDPRFKDLLVRAGLSR